MPSDMNGNVFFIWANVAYGLVFCQIYCRLCEGHGADIDG